MIDGHTNKFIYFPDRLCVIYQQHVQIYAASENSVSRKNV